MVLRDPARRRDCRERVPIFQNALYVIFSAISLAGQCAAVEEAPYWPNEIERMNGDRYDNRFGREAANEV